MKPAIKSGVVRTGQTKRSTRVRNASAMGATNAMSNALAEPPKCPAHLSLRPQDKPFWDDVLRARAFDEWGRTELTLAWQLAGVQGDIKVGRALIAKGDRAEMEQHGFPSVRAVSAHVGTLIAQQLQLMRALRIVGNVIGDPEDVIPRRKAEREAEQTIARLRGDTAPGAGPAEPPLLAL